MCSFSGRAVQEATLFRGNTGRILLFPTKLLESPAGPRPRSTQPGANAQLRAGAQRARSLCGRQGSASPVHSTQLLNPGISNGSNATDTGQFPAGYWHAQTQGRVRGKHAAGNTRHPRREPTSRRGLQAQCVPAALRGGGHASVGIRRKVPLGGGALHGGPAHRRTAPGADRRSARRARRHPKRSEHPREPRCGARLRRLASTRPVREVLLEFERKRRLPRQLDLGW
jgi:hypothetical protein